MISNFVPQSSTTTERRSKEPSGTSLGLIRIAYIQLPILLDNQDRYFIKFRLVLPVDLDARVTFRWSKTCLPDQRPNISCTCSFLPFCWLNAGSRRRQGNCCACSLQAAKCSFEYLNLATVVSNLFWTARSKSQGWFTAAKTDSWFHLRSDWSQSRLKW